MADDTVNQEVAQEAIPDTGVPDTGFGPDAAFTEVNVPEFEAPAYDSEPEAPQGEVAAGTNGGDIMSEMFPDTPELVVPPTDPEAHRGTITGVTREDASTGSVGIKIALTSTDTGLQTDYTIWPPIEFVEDIKVDPTTLSDEPRPGKKQSPKERYGQVVRNSTKTGEIQRLLQLAAEQDRHATKQPEDFDDFVAMMDQLLSGVLVVFTRKVEKAQEGFSPRLKVSTIENITTADNPKKFKKMIKRWEAQS